MAEPLLPEALRGLVLSASEVKILTDWPDQMVEDYLYILENILTLSTVTNQKQDILRPVTSVDPTMSPYEVLDTDQELDFDTTDGDIVAVLPTGIVGRWYRMTDIGTGGNKVILSPTGEELLFGVNEPENLYNAETFIMTFRDPAGWW
jgi:hypothetical protein